MRSAGLAAIVVLASVWASQESNVHECSAVTETRALGDTKCALPSRTPDEMVDCSARSGNRDAAWAKCGATRADIDLGATNNTAPSKPPAWMCATSGASVKKRAEVRVHGLVASRDPRHSIVVPCLLTRALTISVDEPSEHLAEGCRDAGRPKSH